MMLATVPVMFRAFSAAKRGAAATDPGADFVWRGAEFRCFLMHLRWYLELFAIFQAAGWVADGRRVSLAEFRAAAASLGKWGARTSHEGAAAHFGESDGSGSGLVPIEVLCGWAIERRLEERDGDDVALSESSSPRHPQAMSDAEHPHVIDHAARSDAARQWHSARLPRSASQTLSPNHMVHSGGRVRISRTGCFSSLASCPSPSVAFASRSARATTPARDIAVVSHGRSSSSGRSSKFRSSSPGRQPQMARHVDHGAWATAAEGGAASAADRLYALHHVRRLAERAASARVARAQALARTSS